MQQRWQSLPCAEPAMDLQAQSWPCLARAHPCEQMQGLLQAEQAWMFGQALVTEAALQTAVVLARLESLPAHHRLPEAASSMACAQGQAR